MSGQHTASVRCITHAAAAARSLDAAIPLGLSCKTQKKHAQPHQKLQFQNRISAPKRKKNDFYIFFSPNSVSTLRGSYGKYKGRCLIRVLQRVGSIISIIPVNFPTKWLLRNVRVHFDCAGSHKVWSPVLAHGILPVLLAQNGSCETSKCILTAQGSTKCDPPF